METLQLEKEFIKKLENQEAQYWGDYYLCCNSPLQDKLGISFSLIKGATCCAVSSTDTLAFNRVISAGLDYEITNEILQEIIQFYRQAGSNRFMMQVSPGAKPENYHNILLQNGFVHHNNWAKSFKRLNEKTSLPNTSINLEKLELSNIDEFEEVIKKAFEFENDIHLLISRTYKKPGWKHYLAIYEGKAIAAASLFMCGKFASLAICGTAADARGKGAQSLLIAKRLNDAIEAGSEFAVVETSEDLPGKPSHSYRNVLKFGFETAYLRPNYVYNF